MAAADIHLTLGEGIEAAVAIGTAVLAIATWKMASATKAMADSADEQMVILRRQAEAAEAANVTAERHLGVIAKPRLVAVRVRGDEISGGLMEDGAWTIMLRNDGEAPAEITEARIGFLSTQSFTLEPAPPGSVGAHDQVMLETQAPPQLAAQVEVGRMEFPMSITYAGPTGELENLQTTIISKDSGERWIVFNEAHKPAGKK